MILFERESHVHFHQDTSIYKYPSIVNAWIIGLVLVLFYPVAEVIPSICLDDQLIKIN